MINISVRVEGRDELIVKLRVFKASLKTFDDAFDRIGLKMLEYGRENAPVFGGASKAKHKESHSAMEATVKVGGAGRRSHAGGIYVAKVHFGGGATGSYGPHYISPNPWLYESLDRAVPFALKTIESEVETKIKQAGL